MVVNLCKRRGFIWAGSEIYGSIGTAYDLGPLGCQMKKNLLDRWWRDFVSRRRDCFGMETAIIQNPKGGWARARAESMLLERRVSPGTQKHGTPGDTSPHSARTHHRGPQRTCFLRGCRAERGAGRAEVARHAWCRPDQTTTHPQPHRWQLFLFSMANRRWAMAPGRLRPVERTVLTPPLLPTPSPPTHIRAHEPPTLFPVLPIPTHEPTTGTGRLHSVGGVGALGQLHGPAVRVRLMQQVRPPTAPPPHHSCTLVLLFVPVVCLLRLACARGRPLVAATCLLFFRRVRVDKLIAAAASDAAPAPAVLTLATMAAWMKASGVKCPHCGASGPKGLGPPRDVNLLFSTRVGPVTPASTQGALLVAGKPLDHRRKFGDIWAVQASVRDERVGARRGVCGGGA